jgi:hypothetical protein
LLEGSGHGYLRTACDYVHLNPVRAHLLRPEERLLAYPWSSLPAYLAAPEHRPAWIRVDRLLGEHGLQRDTPQARREFEQLMELRRLEETAQTTLKVFRRGWCFGSQQFRQGLLEQIEHRLGEHHSGELHRQSAEAKAERILAEELSRLGWTPEDLAARRKRDPVKLALAARLRRERQRSASKKSPAECS